MPAVDVPDHLAVDFYPAKLDGSKNNVPLRPGQFSPDIASAISSGNN